MKKVFIILYICFCLTLCGCQGFTGSGNTNSNDIYKATTLTEFYFDTVITITIYDGKTDESFTKLIENCFSMCDEYEQIISRTIADSDTSKINTSKGEAVTVSDTEAELIKHSLYYSELTKGKFDITIAPLSTLWNFGNKDTSVPSENSIISALTHIDYNNIILDGNTITLKDSSAAIDLGGIAKGYIADKLKSYLLSEGITSALINLGGNVLTIGTKPDGSAFKIGITKPFSGDDYSAIVNTKDKSVVTSGVYERCFYENDKLYHHILDPDTGYPCDNGLYSVTIISDESIKGDALSTSCLVLGLENGLKLINSQSDVEAIFIDNNYELHLSDDLEMDDDGNITLK